ncbi:hypothetical protein [Azospirillum largimobile]
MVRRSDVSTFAAEDADGTADAVRSKKRHPAEKSACAVWGRPHIRRLPTRTTPAPPKRQRPVPRNGKPDKPALVT